MNKRDRQQSSNQATVSNEDSALKIIMVEYERQQQRFQTSVEIVNQTFTIYIAVLAFLTPIIAGAVLVWSQNPTLFSLAIAALTAVVAVASLFTLVRSYQARMEQTDSEKALCRLRNYFVRNHPDIRVYLSDPIHDDWPTPYTHQWRSFTFYGWLSLVLATGIASGLSVFALLLIPNVNIQPWARWSVSVLCAVIVSCLCYVLLVRKLWSRREADTPRFPR